MTERIVLIFAWHFPPESAVGGRRPFRFARYLREMGYRCHVITAADQAGQPESDVEFVPDTFESDSRHGVAWQLERMIRRFFLPAAAGLRWSRFACEAAQRFARANPQAEITIYSTAPPLGPHLAAWQFSRASGLKWVADFRDPLTPGPWGFSPFHRTLFAWIESVFLRAADIVVANTDAMAEQWRTAHPARSANIHLIWNGFDPEERLEPLPLPARDYRLYCHTGELYAGRNITPLLESVSRLLQAGRLSASRLRIRLVGEVDRFSMPPAEFVQRAQAQGWLEIIARPVPEPEARLLMQTSDGLLLVQPHSALQVPGKLFDYIQMGRPVLAYIPRHTPIERVLRQSGIPCSFAFVDSSQAEFDSAVESFFSLPSDHCAPSVWFGQTFDAREQTRRLARLIGALSPAPAAGQLQTLS